jgi:hypothetical protein
MTGDEFERMIRNFIRQRPFRPFIVEFITGDRVLLGHPEVIDRHGDVFTCRGTDQTRRIFTAQSVCQVIEIRQAPEA